MLGWLSQPETGTGNSGVIVLPPTGYPYLCAHRALRVLAERLAERGHTVLRIDYDGTGDSAGDQWDPVLAGLCASAWIVLHVVLRVPVSGVIALNPQMYWQPGWPIEVDPDLGDRLRAKEFGRHERGARWHVWSLLDMIGRRPPGGRWLDQLAATGVPVTMLFAEALDEIDLSR
jgi:hypothetical protein